MTYEIPNPDQLKNIAEIAIKLVPSAIEKIHILIKKLQNKDAVLIEDEEIIDLVKTESRRPENEFYKKYISETNLKPLIAVGFILRRYEKRNEKEKLTKLREKIRYSSGTSGLHVAEFVQRGLLSIYIPVLFSDMKTEADLKREITEFLNNIDQYVWFVQKDDSVEKVGNVISQRINGISPNAFFLFSRGKPCNEIGKNISDIICNNVLGYERKFYQNEQAQEYYIFVKTDTSTALDDFI